MLLYPSYLFQIQLHSKNLLHLHRLKRNRIVFGKENELEPVSTRPRTSSRISKINRRSGNRCSWRFFSCRRSKNAKFEIFKIYQTSWNRFSWRKNLSRRSENKCSRGFFSCRGPKNVISDVFSSRYIKMWSRMFLFSRYIKRWSPMFFYFSKIHQKVISDVRNTVPRNSRITSENGFWVCWLCADISVLANKLSKILTFSNFRNPWRPCR